MASKMITTAIATRVAKRVRVTMTVTCKECGRRKIPAQVNTAKVYADGVFVGYLDPQNICEECYDQIDVDSLVE